MEAQIAVARIGAERLGGLIERYIESHLPLRVSRYELREGVSGAGSGVAGSARCASSPI